MSGPIYVFSDAGRDLVLLPNVDAMVGFLGVYTIAQTDNALAAKAALNHSHAIGDVTGLQSALFGLQGEIDAAETLIAGKANLSHSHAIGDVTNLQAALDGKAALSHSHAIGDVTNLQAALDGKAASSHSHAIGDVTNLQAALDGKAASSHSHAIGDVTNLQAALDGKAASSHSHAIGDVTGLETALDAKAALAHSHAIADVTNLQAALNGKANTSHSHAIADIQGLEGFAINQEYTGAITWTGTTAPSGTATLRFNWYRIGRFVFVQFRFEWTVAGAALTVAQWNFPTGLPLPVNIDGLGSTEVYVMANGVAGPVNLAGATSGNITEARMHWFTGGDLQCRVRFASTSVGSLHFSGCYICQS